MFYNLIYSRVEVFSNATALLVLSLFAKLTSHQKNCPAARGRIWCPVYSGIRTRHSGNPKNYAFLLLYFVVKEMIIKRRINFLLNLLFFFGFCIL